MITKERLQDIIHSHTTAIKGEIVLHPDHFEKVYQLIIAESENENQEAKEAAKWLIDREGEIKTHYSGRSLLERLREHIQDAERKTQSAIADKKGLIEDALVYFRSVAMITESIGMAGTHAEKSARLRGLIELLNSAIAKLRQEQTDSLLNNWEQFHWGYSDYPYKRILEQFKDLQRANEEMKKIIEKHVPEADKIPF